MDVVAEIRKRVLCVDDDPQILEGICLSLRGKFEVATCNSGSAGLKALETSGPFTAIVSDMQMPEMNGVEFLRRARMIAPSTVRILLTGEATIASAVAAVNEGHIFQFLTKPCSPDDLRRSLEEAVVHYSELTSERLRLEEKLQGLSQQLVQANRLATLGSFANAIGHELNNILTVYWGTLGLMKERAELGLPPNPEHLQALSRVGTHLKKHGTHLLNLGKPHSVAVTHIDLRTIVAETLLTLKTAGKTKYIVLDAELCDQSALIRGSRTQIEQVLINLIGNAVDALSELDGQNGSVRVVVENDFSNSRIRCRVEDNGCGIPADKLEEIFQTYYTTKPLDRGTGLGLAIARQIVEAHQGVLYVQSRVGEGSVFTMDFPSIGNA